MARIDDLPVELVDFIADHLRRVSDLAALARASHKFYNVVDTLLYTFAKENLQKHMAWHPLRWAAENGQTGTLKKALAAGIDVNMAFVSTTFMAARDWESFQIRVEAVDGKGVWDPPRLEPNLEWEPHEDDTDEDDMPTSTSTVDRMRPGYTPPPRRYANMDDGDDGWDGVDDFDPGMDPFDDEAEADFMAHFTHPFTGDYWSDDEMDDEDDDDFDMGEGDDEGGPQDGFQFGHQPEIIDDRRSFRALHLAARGGHDDVVAILLDHGASIDVCSRQLCRCVSILSRAASGPHGIPIVRDDLSGFSPLHLAICHFQADTARLLLSRGASPRLSEPQRDSASTALHAAAATGQVDLCKHILDRGFVEVDAVDHSGLTPFYHAYRSGQWSSTVAFLLERGADVNFLIRQPTRHHGAEGGELFTAIYEACVFGCYAEAIKLINLGADVNKGHYVLDVQHKWPLHAVCEPPKSFLEPRRNPAMRSASASAKNNEEQRVELIKLMLRSGADLEAKTRQYLESPLLFAATHCDVAVLQVLLAEGANVESQNSEGRTPLLKACGPEIITDIYASTHFLRHGSELVAIKMLLDHGAKINAKDKAGNTPLHLACSLSHHRHDRRYDSDQKQERIVRILLQRGAKDSVPNNIGMTPFETAFRGGLLGVCDILVRRRQSPQPWRPEDFDRMILATIVERPYDLDAVDLLLDLDVNGTLFGKSAYLMKMIDGGHVKMASRYLERGATRTPLSPKDKLTILQEGLARGNETLVKQMLALKVSVNFADKNGHTPLYVVLQGSLPGKEGLVRALLEAGADIHFKPPLSTIMTPLEKAVMFQQHALVDIMLQHQPLRNNPKAPKGVYLHAAARTVPSKRMFSALIRSGASVTELDSNGDTPLSVFLKSVADQPHWMAHTRGAANQVCATVWYLWNKKVDINLRNKSGKAITSYLTALRIYNGDNLARKRIAEELQLCVEVVPAEGADEAEGLKTLRFRHGLMGLGKIGSQGVGQ